MMSLAKQITYYIDDYRFFIDDFYHKKYSDYWFNEFSSLNQNDNFNPINYNGHYKIYRVAFSNDRFSEDIYFDIKKIQNIIEINNYSFSSIPLDYINHQTKVLDVSLNKDIEYPNTPIYITPFPYEDKTLLLIDGNHRYKYFSEKKLPINNHFIPENFLITFNCFMDYKSLLLYIFFIELNTITRLKQTIKLNDDTIFENLYMNNNLLFYDYMKLIKKD